MEARSPARRGFSLVEVCLTVGILATLIFVLVNSIVSTARQSKRAADLLAEAVAARSAMCQVRDALAFNPTYIRHLESDYGFTRAGEELVSFGTLVAAASPSTTPQGALTQSPFFRRLLPAGSSAAGAALVPPGAALTAEERAALEASLADFAVKVRIADAPRPLEFLGSRYGERNLKEMVRKVSIDIYRLSEAASGAWQPAYTAIETMLSPVESLSLDAALDLNESLKNRQLGQVAADVVTRLRTRPQFAGYDDMALQIAARIFLIYQEVNVEALLCEGRMLVPAAVPAGTQGIRQQIAAIQGARSSYLVARRGALHEREAQVIYQTFQRCLTALEELEQLHRQFEELVARARSATDQLEARARALVGGFASAATRAQFFALVTEMIQLCGDFAAYVRDNRALLLKAKLFEFVFNDPDVSAAIARTRGYPQRMTAALAAAQDTYHGLATDPAAAPGPRARALLRFVEVAQADRILQAQAALPAPLVARLEGLRSDFSASFPMARDYLTQSDLTGGLDALQRRFFGFAGNSEQFRKLGTAQSPLVVMRDRYRTGGALTAYLDQVSRVPGNLVRAAWNMGGAAANVGLSAAEFNQNLARVSTALRPAIEEAIRLGLTTAAAVAGGARPNPGTRSASDPFDTSRVAPGRQR